MDSLFDKIHHYLACVVAINRVFLNSNIASINLKGKMQLL